MTEVRNIDGHLVCLLDETTGAVEIRYKKCITLIEPHYDGRISIIQVKDPDKNGGWKNGTESYTPKN